MILYNFKYRGPYEYEKFVLNICQFLNEMKDIQDAVKAETSSGLTATTKNLKAQIDALEKFDLMFACAMERSREL